MKIAILGTGNVGGALAFRWAQAGHKILLGVRDTTRFKGIHLLDIEGVEVHSVQDATKEAEVLLIAAPPQHIERIIDQCASLEGKVVIDAMNSIRTKPEGYDHTFEAIQTLAPGSKLVKCFNCTGFENMKNPIYQETGVDMFMAGSSQEAKKQARQLALDAGFGVCHDFGKDVQVPLLEQFAMVWINLAIVQGQGRDVAFKLMKR